MSPAPHPRMHGLTHVQGGPDPIPGLLPRPGEFVEQIIDHPCLVHYWRMGAAAGDQPDIAPLYSPVDLQPQVVGAAGTYNVEGALPDDGAFLFNGQGTTSGDYFSTGAAAHRAAFLGTDPFTVEAWVMIDAGWETGSGAGGIVAMTSNGSDGWGLEVTWDAGAGHRPLLRRGVAGTYSTLGITAGVWHHLACTYDGSTSRIYVDGTLFFSEANAAGITDIDQAVYVGYNRNTSPAGYFPGRIDEVAFYDCELTAEEIAAHAAGEVAGTDQEGWVLELDEDGNPVWVPPAEVTVNGDDPDAASTPLPVPDPPPEDPDDSFPDDDDWIVDQPFTWNGSTFEVLPRKWTTIPFTAPVFARQSNVTGIGTTHTELDWDDPSAAGWVNPDTPRVLTVPHNMAFLGDAQSWMQVCLKLESPIVQPSSIRALRIFETTHQKTLVSGWADRASCCEEHGGINVYEDGGDTFAEGDTGGADNGGHPTIMFLPNSGFAYYLNGNDWLPQVDGVRTLTAGMRLLAQVWHDATVPLEFDCSNSYPYRPHFVISQTMDRDWGSPWSDWPTY